MKRATRAWDSEIRQRWLRSWTDRHGPVEEAEPAPVRLEFPILSLNPGLRQRCRGEYWSVSRLGLGSLSGSFESCTSAATNSRLHSPHENEVKMTVLMAGSSGLIGLR